MRRSLLGLAVLLGLAAAAYFAFRPAAEPGELGAQMVSTPQVIEGFARAFDIAPMEFPRDLGPHPEFQTEWWYYTGNLETADGRHFGYELTFFRRALASLEQVPPRSSQWATNQIYLAHFTLTDVQGEDFYAFERLSRGAAGLAGAQSEPAYAVWLEDWRVEATSSDSYLLRAANADVAIELSLTDEKGPILQGEQGLSRKGAEPGNASYYYSQPRLASVGTITIGGETFGVDGLSWKDHEYSTSVLSSEQIGWDWFSIQLDDGYELMLYDLRRADGSPDAFSSGTLIAPDGSTTELSRADFEITALGSWHSPHSGAEYPMGWRIRLEGHDLELEIWPYLEDQELNLTFTYWEGAVYLQGTHAGRAVSGAGYVELTGYAAPFNGQF